jgi:hypothetical protein
VRCLFCKDPSDNSRSVEYFLPESPGNTTAILPPGIVCDTCNNYFSRKVEAPLLNSEEISAFRFHQAIPSKRGRIPPLPGMMDSNIPLIAYRYREGPIMNLIDVLLEGVERTFRNESAAIDFPAPSDTIDGRIMSRFLAKTALEWMAFRLRDSPEGVEYLVNEISLDPIRNYARYLAREPVLRVLAAQFGWLDRWLGGQAPPRSREPNRRNAVSAATTNATAVPR